MSAEYVVFTVMIALLMFFLGWFVSATQWMSKFGDRVTRLEGSQSNTVVDLETVRQELRQAIKEIKESIKGINSDTPPCSYHIDLDKRVVRIEAHLQKED